MDEKKLEEMYEMTKSNNSMLKSMRRTAFVGGIIKFVFYIVILIVLPYYTWLYLQPYLDTVMQQYQQMQGTSDAFKAQIEAFGGNSIFEQFKSLIGTSTQ
ncbi:MAG: hypothetical protein AAB573_01105 [Patescibacteria group bacterium]